MTKDAARIMKSLETPKLFDNIGFWQRQGYIKLGKNGFRITEEGKKYFSRLKRMPTPRPKMIELSSFMPPRAKRAIPRRK